MSDPAIRASDRKCTLRVRRASRKSLTVNANCRSPRKRGYSDRPAHSSSRSERKSTFWKWVAADFMSTTLLKTRVSSDKGQTESHCVRYLAGAGLAERHEGSRWGSMDAKVGPGYAILKMIGIVGELFTD